MQSSQKNKSEKRKNLKQIPDGPQGPAMRKCFLASLIIHALVLGVGFSVAGKCGKGEGDSHSPTQFEVKEGEGDKKEKGEKDKGLGKKEIEMQVIPKQVAKQSDVQTKPEQKPKKNGFYGIGVGMKADYNSYAPKYGKYAIVVKDVYEGYAAFDAGLQPGDVIVEVDGKPVNLDDNGIKGKDESPVRLTVYRSGRIINFKINRCFVETLNSPTQPETK